MATQHANKHEPEHKQHEADPPVAREPKPAPPPPHEMTTQEEQLARSEEIQKVGVDQWVTDHDERTDEEKQSKPVTGVAPVKATTPEASRR